MHCQLAEEDLWLTTGFLTSLTQEIFFPTAPERKVTPVRERTLLAQLTHQFINELSMVH